MVRRLIWIPVVHDTADLGTLVEEVKAHYGESLWEQHTKGVSLFWDRVEACVARIPLPPHQTKVYQDGLPVEGEPGRRLVEALARRGSRNHRIILSLLARGAKLVATEDPALLLEEYELARRTLATSSEDGLAELRRRKQDLLRRRDAYIARRIGETLHEGEMGILFLGLLHDVRPYLPADVRLSRILPRVRLPSPPLRAGSHEA